MFVIKLFLKKQMKNIPLSLVEVNNATDTTSLLRSTKKTLHNKPTP